MLFHKGRTSARISRYQSQFSLEKFSFHVYVEIIYISGTPLDYSTGKQYICVELLAPYSGTLH